MKLNVFLLQNHTLVLFQSCPIVYILYHKDMKLHQLKKPVNIQTFEIFTVVYSLIIKQEVENLILDEG